MRVMRRVCCFCQSWESGGIESFLHNVLLRVDLSRLQVDIVAEELRESIFTEPLLSRGICFFELSGDTYRLLENYRSFRHLIQRRQYDVVHLNVFQGMSLYYAHIAKKAGIPVRIAHSHNTDLRQTKTRRPKLWLHHTFCKKYAKDASEFWACSESAAKFMVPDYLREKMKVSFIPNGIDLQKFRMDPVRREEVRQENGWTDYFIVGNVGRLCCQKNQSFLIDVFREFLLTCPKSRLLLIGDGEDKEMLRKKAEKTGVLDKTIFYGTSNQIEQLFWAMDVLAFPSRFEGFGIVALEAQAAGLPVVCSESVPEEARISPLLRPVPLSAGTMQWAKALRDIYIQQSSSSILSGEIPLEDSIYDISKVSKQIEDAYLHSGKAGESI